MSPDGNWVAYSLSNPHEEGQGIYLGRADGKGNQQRLTAGGFDADPCWSPDSRKIAFTRTKEGDNCIAHDVWVVDRDKPGSQKALAKLDGEQFIITGLAWSPDGETIILDRCDPIPELGPGEYAPVTHSIWSLQLATGRVLRIPIDAQSATKPAWFPDGSRIVCCATKSERDPWQLYVCEPDGSDQELLADTAHSVLDAAVSPNGRYVAFVRQLGGYRGPYSISVFDRETGRTRQLQAGKNVSWRSPSWGRAPATEDAQSQGTAH